MAKSILAGFEFGGVDSRSNPLRIPPNRSLRCRNFVPKESGILELRYGYSTVTQSITTATAIHSIIPYRLQDETRYVVLGQGSGTPKLLTVSSGAISTPTVKGAAFSASTKAVYYVAGARLHYSNGTDQKVFDGTTWRNSGLRALTDAEIASVIVAEGVRELTAAQGTSVTLATSGAAGLATTTLSGYGIHVAIFDTTANELGPATFRVSASQARVTVTAGPKQVDIAVMPDLSATNTAWVKLVARTVDGGSRAYFVTKAASMTSVTLARSGSTGTFTKATHGYSTGDCLIVSGATDTKWNKVWSITVVDANTFTVTLAGNDVAANFSTSETGLTTSSILKAANAATTATLNTSTTDTSYIVNQDRGLAATTITNANAGYQFYASIYNRSGGIHVGNRIAIGGRIVQTAYRFNVRITGLPDLSGSDTEYDIIIGRTGEAALLPYAVSDGTNWIYAGNADTKITITQSAIDGAGELPSRNGIIPATVDKVALVGSRVLANKTNSPYVYKSASLSDDINAVGTGGRKFSIGRPEQSFAPNDLETFPTSESLTALGSYEYSDGNNTYPVGVCWSKKNCAILIEHINSGALVTEWIGPWAVGCAGRFAFVRTPYGLFWLTSDKQLATFANGIPQGISGEYEAGLLANIGTTYLADVELHYINIPSKGIDHIRIEGRDSSGNPLTIYHDFKLEGQAYDSVFLGNLAVAFTSETVLDSDGAQQIWASPASGSGIGQLYLLNSGAIDGATEFTGDYITLLNAGPQGVTLKDIDWFGDEQATIWLGDSLSATLDVGADTDFEQVTPESGATAVPGEEDNFHYRSSPASPNLTQFYLRVKLASHSTDGSLASSSPVAHLPVEDYGRVYGVQLNTGSSGYAP